MVDPVTFAPAGDPAGQEWIRRLPALLRTMCRCWGLALEDDTVAHGYSAVVLRVTREGERFALKLTWPADGIVEEAQALAAWDGRGTVRMIESDIRHGSMLLERLDASRTLLSLAPLDAAPVAGGLMRRLAIPAPPGFRDLRDLAGTTRRSLETSQERAESPVPAGWVREAITLARHFEHHAGNDLLIHSDLHYDNILAGGHEPWLAIDPRAVAGEPECAVPVLMWTRADQVEDDAGLRRLLALLVESGSLDAEKARSWVIVRCVDYWLWGLEHGLTRDPECCRRVLQALTM